MTQSRLRHFLDILSSLILSIAAPFLPAFQLLDLKRLRNDLGFDWLRADGLHVRIRNNVAVWILHDRTPSLVNSRKRYAA